VRVRGMKGGRGGGGWGMGGGRGASGHALDFTKKEKRKKEDNHGVTYIYNRWVFDFLITMAINSDTRWGLVQFLLIHTPHSGHNVSNSYFITIFTYD